MSQIRRLVLDILKPHEPSMVRFAEKIQGSEGVQGVNAKVYEIDEEVRNLKITVEGESISEQEVREIIEDLGGSIHSIDEIVTGERMVEESKTPQDK